MKVFISQPMNGHTDEEIKAERERIITDCKTSFGDSVEIIDSFFEGAPHDAKPLWFLGKSLEVMADADIVLFAPSWEKARGCRMEHTAALEYGLNVMDELGGGEKK